MSIFTRLKLYFLLFWAALRAPEPDQPAETQETPSGSPGATVLRGFSEDSLPPSPDGVPVDEGLLTRIGFRSAPSGISGAIQWSLFEVSEDFPVSLQQVGKYFFLMGTDYKVARRIRTVKGLLFALRHRAAPMPASETSSPN